MPQMLVAMQLARSTAAPRRDRRARATPTTRAPCSRSSTAASCPDDVLLFVDGGDARRAAGGARAVHRGAVAQGRPRDRVRVRGLRVPAARPPTSAAFAAQLDERGDAPRPPGAFDDRTDSKRLGRLARGSVVPSALVLLVALTPAARAQIGGGSAAALPEPEKLVQVVAGAGHARGRRARRGASSTCAIEPTLAHQRQPAVARLHDPDRS